MATAYRTPSPLRHIAFAGGGFVALVLVLFCAVGLLDQLSQRTEESVRTFADVERVELDLSSGEVELVPARGKEMVVREKRHSGLVSPSSSRSFDGRTLKLDGGCDVFVVLNCKVDYRIEVPRGTTVDVQGFAGSITARDIRGSLHIDNKAGDVRAINVRGPRIEVRTRAGDAEVRDVVGRYVSVETAAGDADARLLRPARDLRVETHAGDATVVVPDVGYRIDADSNAGDTNVKVRRNDLSKRTLRVRTKAGDASIRPLPK